MMARFEPKQSLVCPTNIWSSDQFWEMADNIAVDIISGMERAEHPFPKDAKTGIIDPRYAARAIMRSVLANICAEVAPAGNA